MTRDVPDGFDAVLSYLQSSRGFDFTGYKTASIARRISKRIEAVEVDSYRSYLDYLQVHPEEFEILFNTILINVTTFFRDAGAWEFIDQQVIPDLLTRKPEPTPIRVWSAGCASGEEAYTLAMLLA